MRVALALVLVAIGTVLFHFLSPWWWTPIASNWGFIDTTIIVTFWITGVVFVAIILFMAYCAWRYRHREGSRAVYEPENAKMEVWLTIGTAVGVVALLTPGLFAWADYVQVPDDATEVEVVGEQWQWSFRLPGEDGVLGKTAISHMGPRNAFGIDPEDPAGQDDVLIASNELHLPLDQPVKVLLRSKDVLHNFYVPQFRAKMDLVPGMVTYFWFTPTRTGQFEILCAELCGLAHYAMRGHVVVDEEADYRAWVEAQPRFAETVAPREAAVATATDLVARGREVAESWGCLACHSLDGGRGVGPTWKGLFGKSERLADGTSIVVDAAYLRESIVTPNDKITEGFQPIMPAFELDEDELEALIAFIERGIE